MTEKKEKRPMTDAERQAKRRQKAEEQGLKSCSIGMVKIEHVDAFKEAARQSREGTLFLSNDGLAYPVTREVPVETVVEKKTVRPVIVIDEKWPIVLTAAIVGFVLGMGALALFK